MRARCPASSANLGPGFDSLALALGLYLEARVEPAPGLRIISSGEGADVPTGADHPAARLVREVLGHDDVVITLHSEIPFGRGLGSSAALALAVAAAAGAPDPLAVAADFDGHVENAAASFLGGLVAAGWVDGAPLARPLPLDESLRFVVVVPDRALATEEARAVLPLAVPLADAVANLQRSALLIAGLGDADRLVAAAGEDRLHQLARTALFPEAPAILEALTDAGATVACWSGAGPSLLAVCTGEPFLDAVIAAANMALSAVGVPGRVLTLPADVVGLVVSAD